MRVKLHAFITHDVFAMPSPLDAVIELIKKEPHSAPALTLYALISTLEFEKTGFLFKLDKLKDLNDEHRQIAYQLMELMVAGNNSGDAWDAAKQQMDELVRAG